MDPKPPASLYALAPIIAAAILLLIAAAPLEARAEEQPLDYQILAEDRSIGSREAQITYLPTPTGELRLLQGWTDMLLPVAKGTLRYRQRLGARLGGDRSFSASLDTAGRVREVQARQGSDGQWNVTVVDETGAQSWTLEATAVDLSSPELFDPERALRTLQQVQQLKLLSAETGAILEGPVVALGPTTLQVGSSEVQAERFRFSPPEGDMTLAYGPAGFLLAYDFQVAGVLVGARLQQLPPPRTYGTVLDTPLTAGAVQEEKIP